MKKNQIHTKVDKWIKEEISVRMLEQGMTERKAKITVYQELRELLNVSSDQINNYRRNESMISLEKADWLCGFFGKELNELIIRDEQKSNQNKAVAATA